MAPTWLQQRLQLRFWSLGYGFVWKWVVYPQWNSHLIGIMISKTIGYNGVHYFQTHPYVGHTFRLRWERISSTCILTYSNLINLHCWGSLQSLAGVVDLSMGMEYLHGGFNGVQKEFKTMKVNCDRNCRLSGDGIQRKTAKTHSNVTTLASLRWSTPKWTWPCL